MSLTLTLLQFTAKSAKLQIFNQTSDKLSGLLKSSSPIACSANTFELEGFGKKTIVLKSELSVFKLLLRVQMQPQELLVYNMNLAEGNCELQVEQEQGESEEESSRLSRRSSAVSRRDTWRRGRQRVRRVLLIAIAFLVGFIIQKKML